MPARGEVALHGELGGLELELLQPADDRCGERLVRDVGERRSAPQRERLTRGVGEPASVVRAARLGQEALEPRRVDGVRIDAQLVAAATRDDLRGAVPVED